MTVTYVPRLNVGITLVEVVLGASRVDELWMAHALRILPQAFVDVLWMAHALINASLAGENLISSGQKRIKVLRPDRTKFWPRSVHLEDGE